MNCKKKKNKMIYVKKELIKLVQSKKGVVLVCFFFVVVIAGGEGVVEKSKCRLNFQTIPFRLFFSLSRFLTGFFFESLKLLPLLIFLLLLLLVGFLLDVSVIRVYLC